MRNRKQQDAPPEAPQAEAVTPFFARYLEGQAPEPDAEANVGGGRQRAEFTYKSAKKSSSKSTKTAKSAKSSKSAKSTAARRPDVTLKYPSDNDELVFYPYRAEAVSDSGALRPGDTTQKFPSDGDEGNAFFALYADKTDVPKGASAKPKEVRVSLSRKRPK